MKLTYLGQAGFAIELNGKHLVFDPFLTGNPKAPSNIDVNNIKADYVLLTHAHGDHIADAELIARHFQMVLMVAILEDLWYGMTIFVFIMREIRR